MQAVSCGSRAEPPPLAPRCGSRMTSPNAAATRMPGKEATSIAVRQSACRVDIAAHHEAEHRAGCGARGRKTCRRAAPFLGHIVRDHRERRRRERRFADADAHAREKQLGIRVRKPEERRHDAPERHRDHDDPLARVAIGERGDRQAHRAIEEREGKGR